MVTQIQNFQISFYFYNIDFKIYWEVIKRAQPIADGNNPVCRLCIKEATAVVYALKDKKLLEQKERIYADLSKTKVQ